MLASIVASAIMIGTWMTRMISVFQSALAKAGSTSSRPQVIRGLKVQLAVLVFRKDSQNELAIGHIQNARKMSR